MPAQPSETLLKILQLLGFDARVEEHQLDDGLVLDVLADDSGRLIGRHGQTLTDLQYLLNRVLNFRSRAPLGPESARYAGAVAVNFGVVLLGVTSGLAAVGVPYQAARVVAGGAEGIFMYSAMRWFVFAAAPRDDAGRAPVT